VVTSADGGVFVGGWFRERLALGDLEITGGRDEHFLVRLAP
jgi:hypothetical protein